MESDVQVGVAVMPFEGVGPADFIRGLRLLGVDFVEINNSAFAEIDRVAENLGHIKTAFHLPLVFHDGWDFSSPAHKQQIDDTIETLNAAADLLKIQHVVSHPPEPAAFTEAEQPSLEILLQNLKRLHLPVYLENIPDMPHSEFDRIYRRAHSALGAQLAGMCFDAPHFYISGYNPIERFRHYHKHVGCIHLSDCEKDDDGHLPFNSGGTLPVEAFLQCISDANFNGFITLEITPPSLDELESYIESYLTTLQYVDYSKYIKKRLRLFALRPLINRYKDSQLRNKIA